MRRIVLACIIVLYSSVGNAAVHKLTWTKDLQLLMRPSLQVAMVTCDDRAVSRMFYWTAMQEGFEVAITAFSHYFLISQCHRNLVNVVYETYTFCMHHAHNHCGAVPIWFMDGSMQFGVLVP